MSDPAKPAGEKKGGGGSVLLVLLVALNLGATGFVAYKSLKPAHVVVEAAPAAPKEETGVVVALDPFVVNLNEPGSSRYLKATFEVEVSGKPAADELERQKRGVRDDVLRYLSGLTVADTAGEANKAKIQESVSGRIDKQLGGGKVKRLFFTEFVVQ
ncbi:MAG TPA: flagellar basal body-associated FliL family protein [Haliangiales bacterium]|nr:flagellar basal body-associated FliL family protein [Haliangiales bacterium]